MATFDRWVDDEFSKRLVNLLMFGVIILSIFLAVNAQIEKTAFFYLGITAVFVLVANNLKAEVPASNFFGNSSKTYISALLGLGLGVFLGIMSRGGHLSVLPVQSLYLGDLSFLLSVIIAPIVEALFWRGVMFPSVFNITKGFFGQKSALALISALLFCAYGFGFFHINVFFQQTAGQLEFLSNNIAIASLFGLLFTYGSYLAGSIALEWGWHVSNNLFSLGCVVGAGGIPTCAYTPSQILPTLALICIVGAVLVEFASRSVRRNP